MSNLRFYLRQAISNSLRNRQRTLFVLFCIAVGVAAVVSLRSVGLMIGDGLSHDLQADLRGDLVITPPIVDERFGDSEVDRSLIVEGADLGSTTFSEAGIERIRAWVLEHGGRVQLAVRKQKPASVYVDGDESGATVAAVSRFVEPERYPFYGSLAVSLAPGEPPVLPLSQALAADHAVVIGERLANALEVSVGARLHVQGAEPFVVTGILADTADARLREMEAVVLPSLFVAYEVAEAVLGTHADTICIALGAGSELASAGAADVKPLAEAFKKDFPGLDVTTTEDLREQNQELSDLLTQLVTTMGLVSLLIGGIGIINTMLVVVGRRTLEISVLKTLGLQGCQITVMFLVEALLLGLVGSALGVGLGVGLLGVLQGVAERVFVQALAFKLYPEALAIGFVMGVLVTLVFGFLPTLAAAKVRPSVVLQPDLAGLPKAGRALSAGVVALLTAVIGLLVGQILGRVGLGMGIAFGAMASLGLLTLIFRGLVLVLAKLPSFGSISIKLTQRALAGHSGRVASTLLALVVGMFALSSILLMTQTLLNMIEDVMANRLGGEVLVVPRTVEASRQVAGALEGLEGVESVRHQVFYSTRIVAINGDRDMAALEEAAYARAVADSADKGGEGDDGEDDKPEEVEKVEAAGGDAKKVDGKQFVLRDLLGHFSVSSVSDLDAEEDRYEIAEGGDLQAPSAELAELGAESDAEAGAESDGESDRGAAEIVLRPGQASEWLGLGVGDRLTLAFTPEPATAGDAASAGDPKAAGDTDSAPPVAAPLERTLTIVGLVAKPSEQELHMRVDEPADAIAGVGLVPAAAVPRPTPYILDLEDDQIQPALRELSTIPQVFALEVSLINSILTSLFEKLTALPLVVAILALFAAGVIIANSVSLAVLERRRQIGVMKAIGLQSRQVLRLLLLENGLVGLAGGVVGCGIGATLILAMGVLSESPGSFPWGTLVALVALAVAIALAATLLTAWGASRERPLIVLRYE
jgi:ABC-type antimicrobial peptide transport system permease subunit